MESCSDCLTQFWNCWHVSRNVPAHFWNCWHVSKFVPTQFHKYWHVSNMCRHKTQKFVSTRLRHVSSRHVSDPWLRYIQKNIFLFKCQISAFKASKMQKVDKNVIFEVFRNVLTERYRKMRTQNLQITFNLWLRYEQTKFLFAKGQNFIFKSQENAKKRKKYVIFEDSSEHFDWKVQEGPRLKCSKCLFFKAEMYTNKIYSCSSAKFQLLKL
jgi:hypothetical protein